MKPQKIRSYRRDVMDRLLEAAPCLTTEFMGLTKQKGDVYPLFYLMSRGQLGLNLKNILISAGIHGEEPAGVYALLRFLEQDISDFTDHYRFLILPCINPFGFEHGYRFNPDGVDINREFKTDSRSREAGKVMDLLDKKSWKFDFTVDLHETDPNWADEGFTSADNPKTFYMWESCPDKSIRIGGKVIEEVRKIVPVCEWDNIYQDVNSGGVIYYPEGCKNGVYAQGTTLESFLNAHYTRQSFTLETPCGWHINQRVFAHCAALRSILELKKDA